MNLWRAEAVLRKRALTSWNLLQPNAQLHQLLVGQFHLSGITVNYYCRHIIESRFTQGLDYKVKVSGKHRVVVNLEISKLLIKLQCVWFCVCNLVL